MYKYEEMLHTRYIPSHCSARRRDRSKPDQPQVHQARVGGLFQDVKRPGTDGIE